MITLLGLSLGLTRTTKQPYRVSIIKALFGVKKLREADEIIVTSWCVTLRKASQSEDYLARFAPYSDDEKESVCVVLTLILSSAYHVEKHYDSDLPLSIQVRFHYIKTVA